MKWISKPVATAVLAVATFAAQAQTVVEYIHTDALGSPVAVTDANQNVVEHSEYEPYGQLLNRQIADGPGYTGHANDATTGLTYMQQRYYDPTLGRFLSVDPITATGAGGSFNRYWYGNNNPYRFTDPDGRCGQDGRADSWGCAFTKGFIDGTTRNWAPTPSIVQRTPVRGTSLPTYGGAEGESVAGAYKAGEGTADAIAKVVEIAAGLLGAGALEGGRASGLGDLTVSEARQIQRVVNSAQRPLEVVGSAAKGLRRNIGTELPFGKGPGTRSDIDYIASPSSLPNFNPLQGRLPSIDPKTGIFPGRHNPNMGPGIRFEPGAKPCSVSECGQ
ncbi:RHS repeat-associated core domain-containing protein [Lysobacter gummosus]|uniref:RHS repeat-associated core domain-containing protein n=1 Tax=Lysobacter gummosus TaxID=262324 RepID=UPI0036299F04